MKYHGYTNYLDMGYEMVLEFKVNSNNNNNNKDNNNIQQ